MSDISDQIEIDALKAASVSNDGVFVTRRSLSEQIAADKYMRAQSALASPAAMLSQMVLRVLPPGGH